MNWLIVALMLIVMVACGYLVIGYAKKVEKLKREKRDLEKEIEELKKSKKPEGEDKEPKGEEKPEGEGGAK